MESALHFTRAGRPETGHHRWWPPRATESEMDLCVDRPAHLVSHVPRGKRGQVRKSSVQTNASALGESTYAHSLNKYWPSPSCVLVTHCPRNHGPSGEWARHGPVLTKLPRCACTHTKKDFLFLALGFGPAIKRLKDVVWKDQLATNKEMRCTRYLANVVQARQVKHTLMS